MLIDAICVGKNLQKEVNVIVEVPIVGQPIKIRQTRTPAR